MKVSYIDTLLRQATLGKLNLKNRIVRSATMLSGAEEKTGKPSDKLIGRYKELAAGGVGLIITGHLYVSPQGQASPRQVSISSDENVPELAKLVEAVHEFGCPIIFQISHAGAVAMKKEGELALGPSDLIDPNKGIHCRAMTVSEIHSTIDDFAKAAKRAKAANADGIQVHLAHGFLLNQFLSPILNKRKDAYGGDDIIKRARIVFELLEELRYRVGELPIWVKISVTEGIEGGYESLDGIRLAEELAKMKADAIEVSGGTFYGDDALKPSRTGIIAGQNEGYFAEEARAIKEKIKTHANVILVGGLRSLQTMGNFYEKGVADGFGLSRPLIAEPDLVNRWASGDREPSECISCNACSRLIKTGLVYCPVMRDAAEGTWAPPPEC
ncbi:MAG TPA: NADH:flavin oxidoreductase [Acetomicrobium flavidum]|uniref:oxidoreductase n=1 Tax=Acetomicrobium flavidum TaxID=49896 RepID=UPI002C10DC4C|nr:NADH:flavin oxidoreductase [Acetomicrobium flavidum]HPP14172.1 NADH:flavin oxidoreductase [Acetomicrobium flavidum]